VQLVSTVLDLLGGVLLVAAVALLAWTVHPALGLAVAGGGLMIVSWLGDRARAAKRGRAARRPR